MSILFQALKSLLHFDFGQIRQYHLRARDLAIRMMMLLIVVLAVVCCLYNIVSGDSLLNHYRFFCFSRAFVVFPARTGGFESKSMRATVYVAKPQTIVDVAQLHDT